MSFYILDKVSGDMPYELESDNWQEALVEALEVLQYRIVEADSAEEATYK